MKIKEIGRVVTGKTPNTKDIENFDGLIKFITPEDIAKGYIIKTTSRHISEKGYESIKSNTLNGISILVGCIGSDMGNVAISEGKCASNQQINAITDIIDSWNPFYVYYYLSMKKQYFRQLAGTTTTPILPKSVFEEIEICDVARKQQDKIVDVLKGFDDKINNNNEIIVELESMAKTIYDYWFLQFEFPNEDGKPYKSSGGEMVWNEELKREIPEGWGSTMIGKITNCFDAKRIPLSAQERKLKLGSIPYYGATGIMDYVNEAILDGDYVLIAEDGSVMDEKGHPILQRVSGKAWINNHAHVLQPSQSHCCKLLMMFLKDVSVMKIKTGSIQLKINQENLNKIPVLDIPKKIIEKINKQLEVIDRRILQLESEKQELISLRDFLLPLLMNGQVSYKN